MEQYGYDPYDNSLYRWTQTAQTMTPYIKDFFDRVFGYDFYHRIRIMLLEPGGYILPHTDMRRFLLDPVNIALNNPEGCSFLIEGFGEVPFEQSSFMKLSLDRTHAVINRSAQNRYHIIVHGRPNRSLWEPLIKKSFLELKKRYT
jgi:hypothetical protein